MNKNRKSLFTAFKIHCAIVFILVEALFVIHALHYAFLQDDAFIYLRYAKNLVEGNGLVWNIGERVEGYADVLWPILLSILLLITSQVETLIHVLTITLGFFSLLLVFFLASQSAKTYLGGFLAIAFLATDRTFAVWSTSGMDTRLYGFLALVLSSIALRLLSKKQSRWDAVFLGMSMILIFLTRPEGALLSFLVFIFVLYDGGKYGKVKISISAGLIGFTGVIVLSAWRYFYYGDLLPNTFYVKVTGINTGSGVQYLWDFVTSFPIQAGAICVCLLLSILRLSIKKEKFGSFQSYVTFLTLGYCAYVLFIGGDFMEFRFLDVVLLHAYPFISVYLCAVLRAAKARYKSIFVSIFALVLVFFNIYNGVSFEQSRHYVLSQKALSAYTTDIWIVIGKWFGKIACPDETIATTAAGAIPYYSGLRCVDILGLCDEYVARLPARRQLLIGHQKMAPPEYLIEKKVTFVIGDVPPRVSERPFLPRVGNDEFITLGEEFIIEVENSDEKVFQGKNFYLFLKTTLDRETLVRSLRLRNVNVFD